MQRQGENSEGSAFLVASRVDNLMAKYSCLDSAVGTLERFEDSLQRDKSVALERLLHYMSKISCKLDIALADVETAELYRISAADRYGKCYDLQLGRRLIPEQK